MKSLMLSELVIDFSVYPRVGVDPQHQAALVEAMENGASFPPIVICRRSRRIVDGFHRCGAYRQAYGDEHRVDVVEKEYRDEATLFLDAMRYNSSHGRILTAYDRAHSIAVAQRLAIDDRLVAGALHIAPSRIGAFKMDRAKFKGSVQIPTRKRLGRRRQLTFVDHAEAVIRHLRNGTAFDPDRWKDDLASGLIDQLRIELDRYA